MMKSEIWDQNSGEKAFTVGYDKFNIDLFDEECEKLLSAILYQNSQIVDRFTQKEETLEKANFLILNDISASLYDCHSNIKVGNIRVAARIFRDVMENMHILELLNKLDSNKYLSLWYKNEVIAHGDYRKWLKKDNSELSDLTRDVYRLYSKYAHRTSKPILESYDSFDGKLKFNYFLDRENPKHSKLLSRYYSHLSYFVINTSLNYNDYGVHSKVTMSIIASVFK